jgi:4-hydroxybenzoyl-CoA thioesterase
MPGTVKWRDPGVGLEMPSNARTLRIEWGDCDPAGIVFYPRYFAMFDHSTTLLIERTLGMSKRQIQETYGFAGYPVVETRARFVLPSRFGDEVAIETSLTAVRRSSFDLAHRLTRDGALAVEGFETRVWTVHDPARPGGLKAQPIPPQLVARLTAD